MSVCSFFCSYFALLSSKLNKKMYIFFLARKRRIDSLNDYVILNEEWIEFFFVLLHVIGNLIDIFKNFNSNFFLEYNQTMSNKCKSFWKKKNQTNMHLHKIISSLLSNTNYFEISEIISIWFFFFRYIFVMMNFFVVFFYI